MNRTTTILAGAILVGSAIALAIPDAQGLEGTARVIDGDTLQIGNARVRLWGIDAFEASQACQKNGYGYSCGRAATQTMEELTRNQHIHCQHKDTDRYGRVVAQCFVGKEDIGRALVIKGWAFDYSHYSGGAYKDAENGAHEAQRGAWGGYFEWPWDYRHQKK